MPTQDLIHYGQEDTYPVIAGGSSDNSSRFLASGSEDWITRKRVETKTTKNVEKRVQRQVVLEDGRIIEEDDPHVTVDTVEDTQSHDEDGDEGRRHYFNDIWPVAQGQSWSSNGDVLSETNRRNTMTKKVQERSLTTASATNLGEISSKDVEKVIRHGKRTRQFIRSHDDDSSSNDPVSIPSKVIHTGKSDKVSIDKEDIREVNRLSDGKLITERHVTREMIEDGGNETPEEGDSSENESHDGDKDTFGQRKEERFVDYYRVPRGKSLTEGQFLGNGIHLTSYDKSHHQGGGVSAIAYSRDYGSDSSPPVSGSEWPSRPPRLSEHRRRSSSSAARRSLGTPRIVAAAPSTPRDTPERYSASERSVGKGSRGSRGTQMTVRSRSTSRSPMPGGGTLNRRPMRRSHDVEQPTHHRSMTTIRTDLDAERSGRLKRAMSFSSKSVGPFAGSRTGSTGSRPSSPSKPLERSGGILGSVKSLYATLRRKSGKENKKPVDQGPPRRPPRKHESTSSIASGNSLDRRERFQDSKSHDGSLSNKWSVYPPAQKQIDFTQESSSRRNSSSLSRHQSSLQRRKDVDDHRSLSSSPFPTSPAPTNGPPSRTRTSSRTRFENDESNRSPPRFEPERHRSRMSRFFGDGDDSMRRDHDRPPPDMRRLLLNNVNATRSPNKSFKGASIGAA